MTTVCVLGLGYVGLPSAAILANNGFKVIGVDVNPDIVALINSGKVHIEEKGLRTLVQSQVGSGDLVAQPVPEQADVFIIAVPTPLTPERRADLSYVVAASESLVPWLRRGSLVILESTVPPGTTEGVVAPILERSGLQCGRDFDLAYCPERVLPGNILQELIANDRVIGGVTPESARKGADLYKQFSVGSMYLTDATTAELVKLAENTSRDVNIALANELAGICSGLGVDAWEVIELANKHPRVSILRPGPGVGGHCISVDPWFLVEAQPDVAQLTRLARQINNRQPQVVVGMIQEMTVGITEPRITIMGVAYKGNVGDVRLSPAVEVIQHLETAGCHLAIYDPHVKDFPWRLSPLEEAFAGSDCAVLLTNHDEFRDLSPEALGKLMNRKQVLDTHNWLPAQQWRDAGFQVRRLGVGSKGPDDDGS